MEEECNGHCLQADDPVMFSYVPAWHSSQALAPVTLEYLPASHDVHSVVLRSNICKDKLLLVHAEEQYSHQLPLISDTSAALLET